LKIFEAEVRDNLKFNSENPIDQYKINDI